MKNLKFLFLAILAVVLLACNNNDDDDPKGTNVIEITENVYLGTINVDQNNGTFYVQDSVVVEILKTSDNTITLTMKKVKFAERMPITLDMVIAGVTTENTTIEMLIMGDNIVPTAAGGEFPQYTITRLEGKIANESISFSMMCGEYPLSYSGTLQE